MGRGDVRRRGIAAVLIAWIGPTSCTGQTTDTTEAGVCHQALSEACEKGGEANSGGYHCASTWNAAVSDSAYCPDTAFSVLAYDCCGTSPCTADKVDYHMLEVSNVDVGYEYYYALTGALVAVVGIVGMGRQPCVGGTSSFVPPVMCSGGRILTPCAQDAGTE